MTATEKAVAWAKQIALDNRHGYSQADRWGPDYDCSSFVISAYEQAGLPLRKMGASYTGNMRAAFLACGFRDVTAQANLASGSGLQAGDVLLNCASHACLHIGGGQVANARSDDGHPEGGDQTGSEIRLQGYWNFPWDCVLRYQGQQTATGSDGPETAPGTGTTGNVALAGLSKGTRGTAVKGLQRLLLNAGYSVGNAGADGIYGNDTFRAVAEFQEDYGLTVTGVADSETTRLLEDVVFLLTQPSADEREEEENEQGHDLPDLTIGSKGNAVLLLQAILTFRGYDCGKPDADFGVKTAAALNRFKQDRQAEPDSKVDAGIWRLLLTF